MKLRTIGLISTLVLGLLAASLPSEAQQTGKIPRIGYLSRKASPGGTDRAFRQALRDLGWVEGKNITIESRWAAFKMDRLPAMAEELVRMKVDLIVTATRRVTLEAKNATGTIPIVMMYASDVVENGLVASISRPGGNITGLSERFTDLHTKLLELLHDTLPKVTRVAFLWNPDSPTYIRTLRAAHVVAPKLGLTLQSLELRRRGRSMNERAEELESRLAAATQERAGALVVGSRTYVPFRRRIAEFEAKNRVPVFSILPSVVRKHFGLLAYAPDFKDMARRAATYVDKILKGAKPADLPVQRPQKYRFLVNLKRAKQLGITIPPEILYQATQVIK